MPAKARPPSALGIAFALAAASCHPPTPTQETSPGPEVAASDAKQVSVEGSQTPGVPNPVPPSMPISQVMGMARSQVETLFFPPQDEGDGWVRYGGDLAVKYAGGIVVELVHRVPGGLSCVEAAKWMGYGEAGYPIVKLSPGKCVWPGISMKHELGEGVAGELTLDDGTFRVWKKGDQHE